MTNSELNAIKDLLSEYPEFRNNIKAVLGKIKSNTIHDTDIQAFLETFKRFNIDLDVIEKPDTCEVVISSDVSSKIWDTGGMSSLVVFYKDGSFKEQVFGVGDSGEVK